MKIIHISEEQENAKFAEEAANHFKSYPTSFTYAESDPTPGKLFAIRWNSSTVLIVKLHEDFEPLGYPTRQFFREDLPRLIDAWYPRPPEPKVIEAPESIEKRLILSAIELALMNIEEPPPPNCSCHIAPPCSDCVDHNSAREALKALRKAEGYLKELL